MNWEALSQYKIAIAFSAAMFVFGLFERRVHRWMYMRRFRHVPRKERRVGQEHIKDIIGIPPRTFLKCIVRHPHAWMVWTGVQDMQQPYHRWVGTYIECRDDGTAYSVQVQPDGSEDVMRIK